MADNYDQLIEGTHHKKYAGETIASLALAEQHLRAAVESGSIPSAHHLSDILAAVSSSRQMIELVESTDTKIADELKASEANMAAAQRIAHFGSWELDLGLTDVDKNPLRWSDEMFRIMGYTPGQVHVSNDLFFQLVPVEDHQPIRQAIEFAITNQSGYSITHRIRRTDGKIRIIHERAELVFDSVDRQRSKLVGTAHDITEMQQAEEKLRRSDEWFRCVFNQRFQFMAILSPTGEVVAINDLPLEVGNVSREDVLGKFFWETIWWNNLPEMKQAWPGRLKAAANSANPILSEDQFSTDSGEIRIADVSIESIKKSDGSVDFFIVQASDITDRKLAETQLIHDALHDSLTGLANRTLFTDRIHTAFNRFLRTGQGFALIILDLDRFKNVNDTLGHPTGDQVLVETSRRFLSIVRASDTVARLGGDEFAIILQDPSAEDSPTRIAQRLLDMMEYPFTVNGTAVEIGASMGVVVVTPDYKLIDDIFRDADIALYRAKEAGRGVYRLFDKEMHTRIRERIEIETEMRHAIPRQELSLHLQPIISLKTGTIISYEALLRWNHPKRGFISPDVFISVAEETGLIRAIGQWVTKEACRILHNWPGSHVPSISINASPYEIVPRSSVGSLLPDVEGIDCTVARIAKEEDINPNLLRIEITEGVLINDPVKAGKIMDRLVANGFKLLLDDFGAGYSSLSYLHDLPFSQVKIDRAFTAKLAPGNRSHELMRGIITLAHNIGLEIVAEGVETEQQLALLRAAGCDYAQGYFISKPIPVEEAHRLHQAERQW